MKAVPPVQWHPRVLMGPDQPLPVCVRKRSGGRDAALGTDPESEGGTRMRPFLRPPARVPSGADIAVVVSQRGTGSHATRGAAAKEAAAQMAPDVMDTFLVSVCPLEPT